MAMLNLREDIVFSDAQAVELFKYLLSIQGDGAQTTVSLIQLKNRVFNAVEVIAREKVRDGV